MAKQLRKSQARLAIKMGGYEDIMKTGSSRQQKAANKPGSGKK